MSSILEQDIMSLTGVGPQRKKILSSELGIESVGDLLQYYPYNDMPFVQLKGQILSFETFDMGINKKRLVGHFYDGTGVVDLVWFSAVKWVIQNYKVGKDYIVFGKPGVYNNRYQITHPDIDDASALQLNDMGMQPYYVTTERMKKAGISSRTMERIMKGLLAKLPPIPETLPDFITRPHHFVSRDEAVRCVHYPHSQREMQKATSQPIRSTPETKPDEKVGRASDAYKDAFWRSIRNENSYEIRNALREGVDSDGGYLVPDTFEHTLIQALDEENIIRQLDHEVRILPVD